MRHSIRDPKTGRFVKARVWSNRPSTDADLTLASLMAAHRSLAVQPAFGPGRDGKPVEYVSADYFRKPSPQPCPDCDYNHPPLQAHHLWTFKRLCENCLSKRDSGLLTNGVHSLCSNCRKAVYPGEDARECEGSLADLDYYRDPEIPRLPEFGPLLPRPLDQSLWQRLRRRLGVR